MMRRQGFFFVICVVLLLVGCGRKYQVAEFNIVPTPAFQMLKDGTFTLSSETSLSFENLGQNTITAKYVSRSLRKMHFTPTLSGSAQGGGLLLRINDTINEELGSEGYLLEVTPQGITISANTERGLFYGYQTLLQMLPSDIATRSYSSISIPLCTILDHPRFEWRSCRIDATRHFFPIDDLKRVLDVMAMYKYNRMVLCIADDYGWRVESELYPALTTIGAMRPDREDVEWAQAAPPQTDEKSSYGGYYSKDDILELVQYAQSLHIEIIPELSIPAHCAALLASCPDMACRGNQYQVQCGPHSDTAAVLCLGNDSTIAHVFNLLDEVAGLFPGSFIHLGGDTVAHSSWSSCPRCRYRCLENSLREQALLQVWFVNQVSTHFKEQNRQVIVWDDLCAEGLSSDVLVMARNSLSAGMNAAKSAHKVVMCVSDYCDFHRYQSDLRYQPKADSGLVGLRKVYDFDPVPTGSNTHLIPSIQGGQCQVSTSHIHNLEQLEYMLLPRMCAMSEALWSPRGCKDWRQFRYRIEYHKASLLEKGFHVCPGSFKPIMTKTTSSQGNYRFMLETEVMNTYVFFTTDGSEPTQSSQIYVAPVDLDSGTVVKTLSVYNGQQREGIYEYHL
ncbi:MAG: family 20 glycosylhydrolase [Bacteroidales bacterium]|nr:family 20 glycosylhydrolase [Bacteroidales bacterium]